MAVAFAALGWISALLRYDGLLADPDVQSHIAIGRWILHHRSVPDADVFSYTMYGTPWVPHEWLAEVALALLYDRFGAAGLASLTAVSSAAVLWVLVRTLRHYLGPWSAALAALSAWAMFQPHLLARPHVIGAVLLVIWVASLVDAAANRTSPNLWLLPLMAGWANVHAGFVLGLAFAGAFFAEAIFEAQDRAGMANAVRRWGPFCLLAAGASLITPYGWAGIALPLKLSGMSFVLSWVNEWQSPNMQLGHPTEYWLLLFLLASLFLGFRLPITRIAMLLALLHLALTHQRHGAILGLLAPILLAPALSHQLPERARLSLLDHKPVAQAVALVSLLLAGVVAVWRLPTVAIPSQFRPDLAFQEVKRLGVSGHVFNSYRFGGYLMLMGIPTFIDGRLDMFGNEFTKRYASRDPTESLLAEYDVRWTLLDPEDPAVMSLDSSLAWKRVYADKIAVAHVRLAE